jgi:hypothetical protein
MNARVEPHKDAVILPEGQHLDNPLSKAIHDALPEGTTFGFNGAAGSDTARPARLPATASHGGRVINADVTTATRACQRHARRRTSPVIVVDPGSVVDRGYPGTPDQPPSPDQPRKCDGSGGCACCGAGLRGSWHTAPGRGGHANCDTIRPARRLTIEAIIGL